MRKTAIISVDAYMSDNDITRRLQPWADNIVDITHVAKPGETDILLIHYDGNDGEITDAVLLDSFRK